MTTLGGGGKLKDSREGGKGITKQDSIKTFQKRGNWCGQVGEGVQFQGSFSIPQWPLVGKTSKFTNMRILRPQLLPGGRKRIGLTGFIEVGRVTNCPVSDYMHGRQNRVRSQIKREEETGNEFLGTEESLDGVRYSSELPN